MFCSEGVLSDSEEDRGPEVMAQQNTTSVWSSKQSAEQEGYSSEASSECGESAYCTVLSHFYSTRKSSQDGITYAYSTSTYNEGNIT